MDFLGQQIAEGRWHNTKSLFKFGRNGGVTTDIETIWDGGSSGTQEVAATFTVIYKRV